MIIAFNPVDYLEPALRYLCALLCRIIYPLMAIMYELFVNISRLNIIGVARVEQIYQRVTLILAIVMLFYFIFESVKYVVQPDKVSDKETGAANILKKLIVVVVLIAFVPKIFTFGYQLQSVIVNKGIISKIVLGYNETQTGNLGNNFSSYVFRQFYYFDGDESLKVRCGSEKDSPECYEIYRQNIIDLTTAAQIPNLLQGINYKAPASSVYAIHFDGLFAVLVGGVLCWMLLLYCVDIGTRWVQLIFLQVIAPIPIIGYLAPKKDNIFNKWVKQCLSVYLSLFIRTLIIYFVLLISYILAHSLEGDVGGTIFRDMTVSDSMKRAIYIFLILGLFTFAKRIPKMLEELFPKMGVATGSLGLKPGDRAGVARGVGMALGTTTGLRTMVARGINRAKRNKFNKDYREVAENDFRQAEKVYDRFKRKNVTRNGNGTYTYKDENGQSHTVSAEEFARMKKDARVEYDSAKAYMENTKYRSSLGAATAGLVGGTIRGAATGAKLDKIDKFGDIRKQMQEVEKNENSKTAGVEKWYDEGGYSTASRVLSGVEQRVGVTTSYGRMQREIQKLDSSIKTNERLIATEGDVRTKLDSVKERVSSRINDSKESLAVTGDNGTNIKRFKVKDLNGQTVNVDVDVSGGKTVSAISNDYQAKTMQAEAAADGAQKEVERLRATGASQAAISAAESNASAAATAAQEAKNLQAKMSDALRDYYITSILDELAKPEALQNFSGFDGVAVSRVKDTLTSVLETARSEDTKLSVERELTKMGKANLIPIYREICSTGVAAGVITSEADLDDIQVALTNSANERTRKNVGLKGTKSRLEASSYYSSTKADDTASGGGSKR